MEAVKFLNKLLISKEAQEDFEKVLKELIEEGKIKAKKQN